MSRRESDPAAALGCILWVALLAFAFVLFFVCGGLK